MQSATKTPSPNIHFAIYRWYQLIVLFVLLMVVVGGITRLTNSGLSITEWKPIMGAIPPLTNQEWGEAFLKYQQIPQFEILHPEMTLSEFKFIYFWEYIHRLIARSIGLIIFVPFFILWRRYKLPQIWISYTLTGVALGGMQGFMGWYMVKSGLSQLVFVSHFRLAAHLLLALVILVYFYWLALVAQEKHYTELNHGSNQSDASLLKTEYKEFTDNVFQRLKYKAFGYPKLYLFGLWAVGSLLALQIIYGAFTAGLKAGYQYNTFPLMNEMWIPTNFIAWDSWIINFTSHSTAVQFIHRWMGVLLWLIGNLFGFGLMQSAKLHGHIQVQKSAFIWVLLLNLQLFLGIVTLIYAVPIALGAIHQLMASLLLLSLVKIKFLLRHKIAEATL